MKRRKAFALHTFTVLALLITLLGFAIRIHHLGGDSFWVDEIATVQTSRTLSGALAAERDHPPLTYLFTLIALGVSGESEFSARLPALFAGTMTLPLLALLGKRLGRPGAGLWAAFLLALAPFHLRFSQEAAALCLAAAVFTGQLYTPATGTTPAYMAALAALRTGRLAKPLYPLRGLPRVGDASSPYWRMAGGRQGTEIGPPFQASSSALRS